MKVYNLFLCFIFNYKQKQVFGNVRDVKIEPISNDMVLVNYKNAFIYENVAILKGVWLLDSQNNVLAKALR